MELLFAMGRRLAVGNHGSGDYGAILDDRSQRRRLDYRLLHRHHCRQHLWYAGLRRGRILEFLLEVAGHHDVHHCWYVDTQIDTAWN